MDQSQKEIGKRYGEKEQDEKNKAMRKDSWGKDDLKRQVVGNEDVGLRHLTPSNTWQSGKEGCRRKSKNKKPIQGRQGQKRKTDANFCY